MNSVYLSMEELVKARKMSDEELRTWLESFRPVKVLFCEDNVTSDQTTSTLKFIRAKNEAIEKLRSVVHGYPQIPITESEYHAWLLRLKKAVEALESVELEAK